MSSKNSSQVLYESEFETMNEISYNPAFMEWLRNSIEFSNSSGQMTNKSNQILLDQLLKMFPRTDPDFQHKQTVKNAVVLLFYSLIIFVSLFGNLLVCYIILSKQRLRSRTTNILILNLTVSDLLLTLFNIPITTGKSLQMFHKVFKYRN